MHRVSSVLLMMAIAILLMVALFLTLPQVGQKHGLRVATTTSLYESGLLDELVEEFHKIHPEVRVLLLPLGSGEALRRASLGDADVVLSHAPNLEKRYIDDGTILRKGFLAINYFVIVGPPDDPAEVRSKDPLSAFRSIYDAGELGKALFVSRDDKSGTNERELLLWRMAGLNASGRPWYIASGAGMSKTLMLANEKGAYTLSDIGTYLNLKDRLPWLSLLVDSGHELVNVYSVYVVNKEKVANVDSGAAELFAAFLLSESVQRIISEYGTSKFGRPLFNGTLGLSEDWLMELWSWLASSP